MLTLAFISQILLLLFHQATTLFDFYPFNNVRHYTLKERVSECCVNGLLMVAPVVGFVAQLKWLMTASLVIYPTLLVGEYLSWWQPYFFGTSEGWQKVYDRLFKNTIVVLPPLKNNPVPNLEHTVLHLLTLAATVFTYIAYFTPR
ncbi:hypothetical protein [Flavisolibacter ginsenosidimutans]|uniref:Uncharacterized protein n=1 Tax=Flavisolibacter ginsenosidimutans TaxID=661481 RepID=A0A5B8ULR3_9BACT|nr:hypothetical protein [Flavisolibacter ginsenosidimutans]QEC57513.1 hypothetical protein FSB75_16930 [Flavisolibacter ginsenosidimutans]